MLNIKTVSVPTQVAESIVCDKCGKVILPDDWIEWQEVATIEFRGGFGSIFGDESSFRCDLCQHCLKDTLGAYIKRTDEEIPE
jgi:hypothetical protein